MTALSFLELQVASSSSISTEAAEKIWKTIDTIIKALSKINEAK